MAFLFQSFFNLSQISKYEICFGNILALFVLLQKFQNQVEALLEHYGVVSLESDEW
jgi:hypothetical protein